MKIQPSTKLLLLCILISAQTAWGQEATTAHKDSLKRVIDQYYSLNIKVFQSQSTRKDIDNLFALFTDDFTYVHPKYGGTYTRQDLYDGYVNNQKNGGYDGSVTDIKIENIILGLNAATVSKRFVLKDGTGDLEMTLLEFRDGKISRIFEYW